MQLLISPGGCKQLRSLWTGPSGCHTGLHYSSLGGDVSSWLYPQPNMFIYYSTAVCSLSFSAQFSGVSGVRGRIKKKCFSASLVIFKFFCKDVYRDRSYPVALSSTDDKWSSLAVKHTLQLSLIFTSKVDYPPWSQLYFTENWGKEMSGSKLGKK